MRKRRVLRILSIVLLLSLLLVPAIFAIYRAGTNGNGTISTAGWQVSINQLNENDYLTIVSGQSTSVASYAINITSNSEVDAVYSIVINNLPSGVSVSADNGETFTPAVNNKVIISDAGTMIYTGNPVTKRHVLMFKAASGAEIVNNQSVDINIIARQVL